MQDVKITLLKLFLDNSTIRRPPEQKISYPIKRCYESENFRHSIVFDRENFCLKYLSVQPLGGAVSGGQSFVFKKKLNVHLFSKLTYFFE
jgi:hypothetical protein